MLPAELRDPDLELTELEAAELRRVFVFTAGYAKKVHSSARAAPLSVTAAADDEQTRLNAELNPKLQRRAVLKTYMQNPDEGKLVDPMHGTPMTEEDVANEFVALAEECDALRRELKAVSSLSMEERRVMVADLNAVFRHYGKAFSPAELEEMLWEADEDMDGALSWEEFKLLCELNLNDRSGLQPWRLFTCVYFLMMDRSEAGFVTEDSVLEILYTRFGKQQMEAEIKALFGDSAGGDTRLTLEEFFAAMEKIIDQRAEDTLRRQSGDKPKGKLKRRKSHINLDPHKH